MSEADRGLCLTMAAGLKALRVLAAFGLALTIIAVLLLAFRPLHGPALAATLTTTAAAPSVATALWLLAVLLLALFERLCAVRIAFDARLFAALAHGQLPSLGALDQSLAGLGLRKNAAPGRDLGSRLSGTRRLVLMHLLVVCTQAVCCGLILWQTA